MELSLEQRQSVIDWVTKGASLSEVQKMLKEQLDISMTFMDVRLLVLEIGAEIKDKPEPEPAKPAEAGLAGGAAADDPYADEDDEGPVSPEGDGAEPLPADGAGTLVSLSLDRVMAPGAMVSGEATFSDGIKARWLIDQYGRFGLEPEKPGYQPTNVDMQSFQTQLKMELRRHGYA